MTTKFRFGKSHWKEFTEKEYEIIKKEREEQHKINLQPKDPKAMYGKLCRACDKPNSMNVTFCTGCSFQITY